MTAGINTKPPIGLLRFSPRPREHEDIPIGSLVVTPTGREAEVVGYRGYSRNSGRGYRPGPGQRPHRVWLVCRYVQPANRRADVVMLLPELATVVRYGATKEVA